MQTPGKGTLNWDDPLNENFVYLDGAVEVRDVERNLSNYTPKSQAKFVATDTGRRFIGDGSSWSELPYPVAERTLLIEATPGPTGYEVLVSGDAKLGSLADPDAGIPDTTTDTSDGTLIDGHIGGGKDNYIFTGNVIQAVADDPSAVTISTDGLEIPVSQT
jgi:hypothetical protein